MAKRILVPLALSGESEAVVAVVAGMARESGGTVRLLHVAPIPEERRGEFGRVVVYADQEMARIQAEATAAMEPLQTWLEGVPVETVVRFGEPAKEIVLEAEAFGADLIALGASHAGRMRGFFGVPGRVLRASRLPVVLLRKGWPLGAAAPDPTKIGAPGLAGSPRLLTSLACRSFVASNPPSHMA